MSKTINRLFVLSAICFAALNLTVFAQSKTPPSKIVKQPTANKNAAQTAPPATVTLAKLEAEVLAEINALRKNPSLYVAILEEWKKNYDGNFLKLPNEIPIITNEGAAAVDEAIAFLKAARPAAAVSLMTGLGSAADLHLRDMMSSGKPGHTGSNGSLPEQRLEIYGEGTNEMKELISYFAPTARRIVINYLTDDGNRRRGHRNALLNNNFRLIGIVTGDSTKFNKVCVIVMADSFIEKK